MHRPFQCIFSYGITEVCFGDSISHTKYCTVKLLMTGAFSDHSEKAYNAP